MLFIAELSAYVVHFNCFTVIYTLILTRSCPHLVLLGLANIMVAFSFTLSPAPTLLSCLGSPHLHCLVNIVQLLVSIHNVFSKGSPQAMCCVWKSCGSFPWSGGPHLIWTPVTAAAPIKPNITLYYMPPHLVGLDSICTGVTPWPHPDWLTRVCLLIPPDCFSNNCFICIGVTSCLSPDWLIRSLDVLGVHWGEGGCQVGCMGAP